MHGFYRAEPVYNYACPYCFPEKLGISRTAIRPAKNTFTTGWLDLGK
jgi:hypothetical protein